jgi:phytoene dehydrogenase-like protein
MDPMEKQDTDIRPSLVDQVSRLDIQLPPHIDDDDSSTLSSASSDHSIRSTESTTITKGNWQADINGKWRYGSSESATSTGISSACSSIAADDKLTTPSKLVNPSKKRMSDGAIKQPFIRPVALPSQASEPQQAPSGQQASQQQDGQAQQVPPKKKRGRPPKDKSLLATSTPKPAKATRISELKEEVRPRSSIPSRLTVDTYASQTIEAAYASRLNPFELHPGEHALLADLLMSYEVTVYLNVRNAILRLWHQNSLVSVTPKEAAGCAKEARFFGLAEVAYKWLVRNGYINFGCVEVPPPTGSARSRRSGKQKTVVVVGAGVSGLTTARQLEHLFAQDAARWTDVGERPPRVIVLEGRKRIGGRVYSKQLRNQVPGSLPDNLRNTVEMGAMIVTGFEHGNPLDTIIRGQLGLRYHLMKDTLTIYDTDGKPVNEQRDMLNTELYADISDRAGDFRAMPQETHTLKGDEELISRCRDPVSDGIEDFQLAPLANPLDNLKQHKPAAKRGRRRNAPPQTEKLTGRTRVIEVSNATHSAARAAKEMGWQLNEGIARNQSISLDDMARASSHPTLGSVMDDAIEQYQDLITLTPQDMRMLNWHHANLEYANAAPVSTLSLSGHDQDTGNEFEGAHSEIVGGYTQLPRGLMNLPTKLDVRLGWEVDSIHYNNSSPEESAYSTKVVSRSGQIIEADQVILTVPLGVLKADDGVDFDPPLPGWKNGVISRMGFGLLNKVR